MLSLGDILHKTGWRGLNKLHEEKKLRLLVSRISLDHRICRVFDARYFYFGISALSMPVAAVCRLCGDKQKSKALIWYMQTLEPVLPSHWHVAALWQTAVFSALLRPGVTCLTACSGMDVICPNNTRFSSEFPYYPLTLDGAAVIFRDGLIE